MFINDGAYEVERRPEVLPEQEHRAQVIDLGVANIARATKAARDTAMQRGNVAENSGAIVANLADYRNNTYDTGTDYAEKTA